MDKRGSWREVPRVWVVYGLLAVLFVGLGTAGPAYAAEPDLPAAAGDRPGFWIQLFQNLFNSRELMRVLGQPEYTLAAFIALNLIVFVETGLLFGFFLPGDSLLVTAGVVCSLSDWNLPLLLLTLSASAIIGDTVGYGIGWHTGPKIFCREKSFFFNKDHLLKAQHFYERHGGKTIILARFMPIIRTFAPVVAGVGNMRYRRFLLYNFCGGIGWVASMILLGYYLRTWVERAFGFDIQDHIEKVVILVVLLSISPGIVLWLRNKFRGPPKGAGPSVSDSQHAVAPRRSSPKPASNSAEESRRTV
jgi:membrane-associated protein